MPSLFQGVFGYGIIGRAIKKGLASIDILDLRNFTVDKHRTVDDRPYGGGVGMVLKPEPIDLALRQISEVIARATMRVVLLSAQGRVFSQPDAERWVQYQDLAIICGRYEGVDERVASHLVDEEVCIGDYVLSGGEPAAIVLVDVVMRLLPGVVGNTESILSDSFTTGLLGYPQYTRPPIYGDWEVPKVLMSGDHEQISRWREKQAIEKTRKNRPDLLTE